MAEKSPVGARGVGNGQQKAQWPPLAGASGYTEGSVHLHAHIRCSARTEDMGGTVVHMMFFSRVVVGGEAGQLTSLPVYP